MVTPDVWIIRWAGLRGHARNAIYLSDLAAWQRFHGLRRLGVNPTMWRIHDALSLATNETPPEPARN